MQLIPTLEITLAKQALDQKGGRDLPTLPAKIGQAFSEVFSELSVKDNADASLSRPTESARAEEARPSDGEYVREDEPEAEGEADANLSQPQTTEPLDVRETGDHDRLATKIDRLDQWVFDREGVAFSRAETSSAAKRDENSDENKDRPQQRPMRFEVSAPTSVTSRKNIQAVERSFETQAASLSSSVLAQNDLKAPLNDQTTPWEFVTPSGGHLVDHNPATSRHKNTISPNLVQGLETSWKAQEHPTTENTGVTMVVSEQVFSFNPVDQVPLPPETGPAFRPVREDVASTHFQREFPPKASESRPAVITFSDDGTAEGAEIVHQPRELIRSLTSQSAKPTAAPVQTVFHSAIAADVSLSAPQDNQTSEIKSTAVNETTLAKTRAPEASTFAPISASPQTKGGWARFESAGQETLKYDRSFFRTERYSDMSSQTASGQPTGPIPTPVQITAHPLMNVAPAQVAAIQPEALEVIASSEDTGPHVSHIDPTKQSLSVPTTSVPKVDLPQQVSRHLAEQIHLNPGKTVDVALSPDELGRVKLSVTASELGVSVNILAERPETMDLLRRNIEQLQQELRLLGYENPGFSFQNEADPRQDQADVERVPAASDPELHETSNPIAGIDPLTTAPVGGLDLRL